jgi:hypothetical protein
MPPKQPTSRPSPGTPTSQPESRPWTARTRPLTQNRNSEDEHFSSDDPGSTPAIIVLSSGDDTVSRNDTLFQSSSQSSSEQLSIASNLVVLSSDEDTGNQSIASKTRFQLARQRTTSTAPLIENDTNDPPPTSQPTDDNPLTDLQDRQQAPLKQLRRCLESYKD